MYADALLLCCSEVNATPVTYNYLQISYQYGQMRSVYTGEYRESLHNPDHIVNKAGTIKVSDISLTDIEKATNLRVTIDKWLTWKSHKKG